MRLSVLVYRRWTSTGASIYGRLTPAAICSVSLVAWGDRGGIKMAIRSDTFGGVVLTGSDAAKFERQIKYGRPHPAAKETLARGDTLLSRFKADEKVTRA